MECILSQSYKRIAMGGGASPFFSLIIPVYNVEKYIERCLQSCVNQTFSDIEIIIVDDCGCDNSITIAKKFAKNDSRIKIIHHPKNLGTFQARLSGLQKAKGEYIFFIDSDDQIATNACEILYKNLSQSQKDCIVFNIQNCSWDPPLQFNPTLNEDTLIHKFYRASICARVYSKPVIHSAILAIQKNFPNLPRLVMCEDALMCFCILYFVKDFSFIQKSLYICSNNPESITRKKTIQVLKIRASNIKNIAQLFENFKNFPKPQEQVKYFQKYKNETQKQLFEHASHLFNAITEKRLFYKFLKSKNAHLKFCIYGLKKKKSWKFHAKIFLHFVTKGRFKL